MTVLENVEAPSVSSTQVKFLTSRFALEWFILSVGLRKKEGGVAFLTRQNRTLILSLLLVYLVFHPLDLEDSSVGSIPHGHLNGHIFAT